MPRAQNSAVAPPSGTLEYTTDCQPDMPFGREVGGVLKSCRESDKKAVENPGPAVSCQVPFYYVLSCRFLSSRSSLRVSCVTREEGPGRAYHHTAHSTHTYKPYGGPPNNHLALFSNSFFRNGFVFVCAVLTEREN